jgi:DNA sulfur modification protein DndD
MKFTQLEITNWAVYRDTATVPLDSTPEKPIILINADNDKGKTSLFYSIRYALFGERGLKNHPKENYRHLEEWPNLYSAKEGDGELCIELTIDYDNKSIRIQRKRKFFQTPTGEKIALSKEDEVTIFENGDPIKVGKDAREIDRWIQINLMPFDASQFFLFDGEVIQKYTEETVPAVESAIQQVLGLSEIKHAQINLSKLLESVQKQKVKKAALTTKDKKLKNDLEGIELELKHRKEELKNAKSERDSAELVIKENNKKINEFKDLRKAKDKQQELQDKVKNNKRTLDEYQEELKEKRDYAGLLLSNQLLKIISTTEETPSSIEQWESQTAAYLIDKDIKLCVCETKIDTAIAGKLKQKILQLKQNPFSNLKRLGENISASYRPDALDVQLNAVVNKIGDTEDQIQLDQEQMDAISKEISNNPDIGEELKQKEKTNVTLAAAIIVLDSEISEFEKKMERLKGQEHNMTTQIVKSSADDDLQKIMELEKYIEKTIKVFVKSFTDYFKIEKPKLEKTITEIFLNLTNAPKKYKAIHLTDNFDIEIERQDGLKFPAHRYSPSAGAGQIAVTAVIAGFNKFSTRKAPVVIDTPAGRLDPIHTENLLEFYPTMSEQVIILPQSGEISPDDEEIISDFIATRYTIQPKSNDPNQSRIVRDES